MLQSCGEVGRAATEGGLMVKGSEFRVSVSGIRV